jgi:methyltransferase (TIGR00027 family)
VASENQNPSRTAADAESGAIKNISDTALWVAAFRALESKRKDALFNDRLADQLVGERGKKIALAMPFPKIMAWIMVVRTVAIDRLIQRALKKGVDTVINLGAGLDTRPYRMDLPVNLNWIEIDFPNIIDLKNHELAGQNPQCHLRRIALDLSDRDLRKRVFQELGKTAKNVLLMTEGVILYLTNTQAAELAEDLHAETSFKFWIQDYRHGGYARSVPTRMKKRLKATPFLFAVENWFDYFAGLGWQMDEDINSFDLAEEISRPFPEFFKWLPLNWLIPKSKLRHLREASGYALFKKVDVSTFKAEATVPGTGRK